MYLLFESADLWDSALLEEWIKSRWHPKKNKRQWFLKITEKQISRQLDILICANMDKRLKQS